MKANLTVGQTPQNPGLLGRISTLLLGIQTISSINDNVSSTRQSDIGPGLMIVVWVLAVGIVRSEYVGSYFIDKVSSVLLFASTNRKIRGCKTDGWEQEGRGHCLSNVVPQLHGLNNKIGHTIRRQDSKKESEKQP